MGFFFGPALAFFLRLVRFAILDGFGGLDRASWLAGMMSPLSRNAFTAFFAAGATARPGRGRAPQPRRPPLSSQQDVLPWLLSRGIWYRRAGLEYPLQGSLPLGHFPNRRFTAAPVEGHLLASSGVSRARPSVLPSISCERARRPVAQLVPVPRSRRGHRGSCRCPNGQRRTLGM